MKSQIAISDNSSSSFAQLVVSATLATKYAADLKRQAESAGQRKATNFFLSSYNRLSGVLLELNLTLKSDPTMNAAIKADIKNAETVGSITNLAIHLREEYREQLEDFAISLLEKQKADAGE